MLVMGMGNGGDNGEVSDGEAEENESEAGPGESNCRNSTISTRMLLIFHPCQEEELSFGRITTRMLIYFILLRLATPFVYSSIAAYLQIQKLSKY